MATLNLINDLIANLTQNEVTKSESGIDRSIGYSQSDKYPNPSTMTVSDDTFRAQMPKQSHPSHPIAKTITPDAKPSFQTKSQRKRKGMESKDENETQINEDVVEEEHLQLSPFTIYILKKFEEKYNITLKPTIENHHHMLPNDFLLVDNWMLHWSELDENLDRSQQCIGVKVNKNIYGVDYVLDRPREPHIENPLQCIGVKRNKNIYGVDYVLDRPREPHIENPLQCIGVKRNKNIDGADHVLDRSQQTTYDDDIDIDSENDHEFN
eukprot:181793_1